jgi:hypothetical protein
MRCSAISSVGVCPPKAKVTRSNRVGCAIFPLFYRAICALGLKLQLCLIRASKQYLEENRRRMQIAWRPDLHAGVRSDVSVLPARPATNQEAAFYKSFTFDDASGPFLLARRPLREMLLGDNAPPR